MTLQLMTRTACPSLRKDVYNVLVEYLGDTHVSCYIVEKLIEMNDHEARVFHTQLRGLWVLCDKENVPDYVNNTSEQFYRDSSWFHYHEDYVLRNGCVRSVSSKSALHGYGWKLKNLPIDLIREIQFHSSDNYYGLCLNDRRVNVSKFKCNYESLAEFAEDEDNDDGIINCMYSQLGREVCKTCTNYLSMFTLYFDGDFTCETRDYMDYTTPGDIRMIQKYTLGEGYTLWIQCCGYKLDPTDTSYTNEDYERCGDYYDGDIVIYYTAITYKNNNVNPFHYYNLRDRSLPYDLSHKDNNIVLCSKTTYSTKNGMEFYSAISIDGWPDEDSNNYKHFVGDNEELLEPYLQPFLKERFGFDLHNPVILELFNSNLEHLQNKWIDMNYDVLKQTDIRPIMRNYGNDEWERLKKWTDLTEIVINV